MCFDSIKITVTIFSKTNDQQKKKILHVKHFFLFYYDHFRIHLSNPKKFDNPIASKEVSPNIFFVFPHKILQKKEIKKHNIK